MCIYSHYFSFSFSIFQSLIAQDTVSVMAHSGCIFCILKQTVYLVVDSRHRLKMMYPFQIIQANETLLYIFQILIYIKTRNHHFAGDNRHDIIDVFCYIMFKISKNSCYF
jgi:predicted acyltransferase